MVSANFDVFFPKHHVCDHRNDADEQRAFESRPEARDRESLDQIPDEIEQHGVDNKRKESECQDQERQRNDHQNWPQYCIQNTEQERSCEQRHSTICMNSVYNSRCRENAERGNEPAFQKCLNAVGHLLNGGDLARRHLLVPLFEPLPLDREKGAAGDFFKSGGGGIPLSHRVIQFELSEIIMIGIDR